MKRLAASLVLLAALILPASPLALADHGSGSGDNTVSADSQDTSQHDSTDLPHLKGLADKEINKRLGSLHALENIVKDGKCISAEDRAKLEDEIKAEESTLPTVKTEIDDDKSSTTEQEHVTTVKTEFHNFALIMPKVHLLRVADRLTCALTKVTAYADKLQTHIDAAKTAGKDVTDETTTMTDMRAQLKIASDDLTLAMNTILDTTPAQFQADPSIVGKIKDELNAGRQAIIKAFKDGNTIRGDLKKLGEL